MTTDPTDTEIARLEAHLAATEVPRNKVLAKEFSCLGDALAEAKSERDAALAQVATAITGNKSGTICRDCRGVGMIHCSDPFNCGGMQPYTVEELKAALSRRDAQMRIADAKDPDKLTNYLHRRENIPAAILAAAEKEKK